jgi:N-acetylmuramoyl-L-alanine amidase
VPDSPPRWTRRALLQTLPPALAGTLVAGGYACALRARPLRPDPRPLRGRAPIGFGRPTVVVDAGHGGSAPGACRSWSAHEKDINLRVAAALADRLRAGRFDVLMTRDSDVSRSLRRRWRSANQVRGRRVAFVSIHANAGNGGRGTRTGAMFIWSSRQRWRLRRRSQRLAAFLGAAVGAAGFDRVHGSELGVAAARRQGRHYVATDSHHGVWATAKRRLSVLDHNHKPAVLVETHWLDNPTEVAAFQTDAAIGRFVRAMEVGLISFFA